MDKKPFVPPPLIVVNEFTFCRRHGEEYCPSCTYDFICMNNDVVMDNFEEEISERITDERESINAYSQGAVPATNDVDGSYKCTKHDKIDCDKCFDWAALITKGVQEILDREKWLKKREKYFRNRDD
ncbi:hypothetical protein BDZ97DRAFT_1130284 [Flammula alnicola]|nr:hypothetical protein BDZ97DRAFT_1130284 [Flammula alnicola]